MTLEEIKLKWNKQMKKFENIRDNKELGYEKRIKACEKIDIICGILIDLEKIK